MRNTFLGLGWILAVTACSSPKEEHGSSSQEFTTEIVNAVNDPLEKAKGLDKIVQDQAAQQKQQMEQQIGQ